MSNSKFTPGLWAYGVRDDGSIWLSLGETLKGPHMQGDLVATEADAKLIVAAPDMVAALERAALQFRYYEQAHREKGTDESMRKAEVNAGLAYDIEQVIAKATA